MCFLQTALMSSHHDITPSTNPQSRSLWQHIWIPLHAFPYNSTLSGLFISLWAWWWCHHTYRSLICHSPLMLCKLLTTPDLFLMHRIKGKLLKPLENGVQTNLSTTGRSFQQISKRSELACNQHNKFDAAAAWTTQWFGHQINSCSMCALDDVLKKTKI